MRTFCILALFALSLVMFCGCASVVGRSVDSLRADVDYSGIYPGLRFDWDFYCTSDTEQMIKVGGDIPSNQKGFLGFFAIFDLPITAVFDTIFLPIDGLQYLIGEGTAVEKE